MLILVSRNGYAYFSFHFKFDNSSLVNNGTQGQIKITFCGFASEALQFVKRIRKRERKKEHIRFRFRTLRTRGTTLELEHEVPLFLWTTVNTLLLFRYSRILGILGTDAIQLNRNAITLGIITTVGNNNIKIICFLRAP